MNVDKDVIAIAGVVFAIATVVLAAFSLHYQRKGVRHQIEAMNPNPYAGGGAFKALTPAQQKFVLTIQHWAKKEGHKHIIFNDKARDPNEELDRLLEEAKKLGYVKRENKD